MVVQEAVELTNESASGLLWWVVGAFLLAVDLIVLLAARSRRNAYVLHRNGRGCADLRFYENVGFRNDNSHKHRF